MAAYNTLLQYILPLVAGILCVFMIFFMRRVHLRANELFYSILIYVGFITALSLFQFILYTREALLHEISVAGFFRIFDYAVYALIPIAWIRLEGCLVYGAHGTPDDLGSDEFASTDRWLSRIQVFGTFFWTCALIVYSVIAGLLMDEGYHIEDGGTAVFYHDWEILFSCVSSVLVWAYYVNAAKRIHTKRLHSFSLLSTAALTGLFLYTLWDTRNIGNMRDVTWSDEPIDLMGWILFLMNFFVILYLISLFTPSVRVSAPAVNGIPLTPEGADVPDAAGNTEETPIPADPAMSVRSDSEAATEPAPSNVPEEEPVTQEELIDHLASEHNLTNREKEIANLVLDGKTNQEIAGELYISLNTVKSHLKNIFRKCGVGTRMELMHLATFNPHTETKETKAEESGGAEAFEDTNKSSPPKDAAETDTS